MGGESYDIAPSVIESSDGSLFITGYSRSAGQGNNDLLLSRLDSMGGHQWSRLLGGVNNEYGRALVQTQEGRIVVVGGTDSYGSGSSDLLLAMFDTTGSHLWTRVVGGGDWDEGWSLATTSGGGISACGNSYSFGSGSTDLLHVSFDSLGLTCMADSADLIVEAWAPTLTDTTPLIAHWSPSILSVVVSVSEPAPDVNIECRGPCGDSNGSGVVTTGDGYLILNYFGSGTAPVDCWSANSNGDGNLTTADGFHLLNYFGSSVPPICGPCEF
jgi:hypothetical protein